MEYYQVYLRIIITNSNYLQRAKVILRQKRERESTSTPHHSVLVQFCTILTTVNIKNIYTHTSKMFSGITSSLKNIGSKAESLFESKKNDAGEMAKDTEAEGARVLDETQEAVKSKAKDTKDGVDKFVNDTANKAK